MTRLPSSFITTVLLGALLVQSGCDRESMEANSSTEDFRAEAFRGRYNITYLSNGQVAAIADAEIIDGAVDGRVANRDGLVFTIKGSVDDTGMLKYDSIVAADGTEVTASGHANTDGTIEGAYALPGREGIYFGFRYNDLDTVSTEYDGEYTMHFVLNSSEIASPTVTVEQGGFNFMLDNLNVDVEGSILVDGTILARTKVGELGSGILSAGKISNGEVSGFFYTLNGERGTLSGERR